MSVKRYWPKDLGSLEFPVVAAEEYDGAMRMYQVRVEENEGLMVDLAEANEILRWIRTQRVNSPMVDKRIDAYFIEAEGEAFPSTSACDSK